MTFTRYPGVVLVVSPAAAGRIRNIQQLKGALVGVPDLGAQAHIFLTYLMIQQGLSAGDVRVVPTGAQATALAALERGRVDAGVLFEPAVTRFVKRYPARAVTGSLRWISAHTPEQILEKIPESSRGDDTDVYLQALRNTLPLFSVDGMMRHDGAEAVKRLVPVAMEDVRKADIDVKRTYTNEFVRSK